MSCVSLLLYLFVCSMPANASIQLSEALEMGRKSPRVEKAASQTKEYHWKKIEASAPYLPMLSASGTYLAEKKYAYTDLVFAGSQTSVPQILPTTAYSLNVLWGVFDGFASSQRWLAASNMEDSAEKDFDWVNFQNEHEITLQFYRVISAKILREVAEQNVKILEDHLKDVTLFRKAGVSTNYDVLRVEVQVNEAKSELLNASDNIEIAKGKLAELLGQASIDDVAGSLPVLSTDLIQRSKRDVGRLDLVSQREKSSAIHHLSSASALYWVPKINLFGQYQYYNNRDDRWHEWDRFRSAYQVGIAVNWNIFDGLASISRSKAAVEQKFQAEKALQISELHAEQEENVWKRKYLYFCNVYRSRINDIAKATESVRLAREGRRVGARTNTDLLDAEGELFRAKAGAVNAQIGSIDSLLNLELASGKVFFEAL